VNFPAFLEENTPILHTANATGECGLSVNGSTGHDFREPSPEAPVIRFVPQRPIQSWRRNLQRIRLGKLLAQLIVFDVEQGAQILADALAVGHTDIVFGNLGGPRRTRAAISTVPLLWIRRRTCGPVDHDAQDDAERFTPELHVEYLEAVAARDPFGRRADPCQFSARRKNAPETQRVG